MSAYPNSPNDARGDQAATGVEPLLCNPGTIPYNGAMRTIMTWLAAVLPAAVSLAPAAADDLEPMLTALQAVGPKGIGNRTAARAWEQLVQTDAQQLPVMLAALDHAGPLAANWIRTAVDAIAEDQLRRGGNLPAAELERFVLDRRHAPRARRLAYEWLVRVDPSAPERLIPGMLDDPGPELRRDAVARLLDRADALAGADKKEEAVRVYRRALAAALDVDQVRRLADRLKKLGIPADLPRQLGFIVRWKLVGPFDNTGEKGYEVVYPPEREIDFRAVYDGKHGKLRWIDYATKDEYGKVDLNAALVEEKEVVAYATARFVSPKQQQVEFRVSSFNAVKLWLNGKLIDEHNVYHGGSQLDQYVRRGVLQPGGNVILLKVCQNAQTQSWARYWGFQLRVCDRTGAAVLSADRDR